MLNRKNHITVTIQEPCSEQWHKMEKSEKGRFCLSCQQHVIDFTTMSNVEIIQYLSVNKNVCGRFKQEQLNVPLHVNKTERKSIFTKFFISSLFSFFYFSNVKSQEVKDIKTEIIANSERKDSLDVNNNKNSVIRGQVLGFNSNNIAIYIKGTSVYTQTNEDGYYTLSIPDSLLNNKITLIAYTIDFGPLERATDIDEYGMFKSIDFGLKAQEGKVITMTMGRSVSSYFPKEKSFKEKLKRFFRRNKAYREL